MKVPGNAPVPGPTFPHVQLTSDARHRGRPKGLPTPNIHKHDVGNAFLATRRLRDTHRLRRKTWTTNTEMQLPQRWCTPNYRHTQNCAQNGSSPRPYLNSKHTFTLRTHDTAHPPEAKPEQNATDNGCLGTARGGFFKSSSA